MVVKCKLVRFLRSFSRNVCALCVAISFIAGLVIVKFSSEMLKGAKLPNKLLAVLHAFFIRSIGLMLLMGAYFTYKKKKN